MIKNTKEAISKEQARENDLIVVINTAMVGFLGVLGITKTDIGEILGKFKVKASFSKRLNSPQLFLEHQQLFTVYEYYYNNTKKLNNEDNDFILKGISRIHDIFYSFDNIINFRSIIRGQLGFISTNHSTTLFLPTADLIQNFLPNLLNHKLNIVVSEDALNDTIANIDAITNKDVGSRLDITVQTYSYEPNFCLYAMDNEGQPFVLFAEPDDGTELTDLDIHKEFKRLEIELLQSKEIAWICSASPESRIIQQLCSLDSCPDVVIPFLKSLQKNYDTQKIVAPDPIQNVVNALPKLLAENFDENVSDVAIKSIQELKLALL